MKCVEHFIAGYIVHLVTSIRWVQQWMKRSAKNKYFLSRAMDVAYVSPTQQTREMLMQMLLEHQAFQTKKQ